MGKNEEKNQIKNYTVKLVTDEGKGTDLTSVMSTISTITGSIEEGYTNLSGTFTTNQKRIADSYNYEEQIKLLKRIAESGEKRVKLAEKERKEAIQEAKTERKRFYISVGVSIVLGILAIIIAILAL